MRPHCTDIVVRYLRRLATGENLRDLPDGRLLERFLATEDEDAFAVLVERHGPLVLRVCRGVLSGSHDVEDAFQATFLVLVRKAHAVRQQKSLGSWLYKVAYRISLRTRARAVPRTVRAGAAVVPPVADPLVLPNPADEVTWQELRSVLDEELRRLPDRYHFPLYLCYTEGKTRDEAAQQLGWSLGTFKRRLEQGRELLRQRLANRGVSLTAALFAGMLANDTARALPVNLIGATVAAARQWTGGTAATGLLSSQAFALAEEGIRSMARIRLMTWTLIVTALGVMGSILAALPALADKPTVVAPREPGRPAAPPALDVYGDPLPRGAIARIGTVRLRPLGLVLALAYSPDSKTVAYGGFKGLQLWEVATGKHVRTYVGAGFIRSVAFSPDGKILAGAGDDQNIRLWDVASGQLLRRFAGDQGSISSVAFSPDGKTLASGGSTYSGRPTGLTLRLWEVESAKLVHDFQGHRERITSVAFSPDGKWLASGPNGDHSAHFLWEAATGKEIRKLDGPRQASVAFTPDGKTLVSGGLSGLRAWDIASGKQRSDFGQFSHSINSIAISPDGTSLVTGGNGDALRLWDLATSKQVRQLNKSNDFIHLAFAPDGKTLAWGGNIDQTLAVWDMATGKELHDFKGHRQAVGFLAFAADGKALVTPAGVWETASGKYLKPFPSGDDRRGNVALSPDGETLAVTAPDGIRLWNLTTGKPGLQLAGTASSLAFSGTGKTLVGTTVATEFNNGAFRSTSLLRSWEVATGKELKAFELLRGEEGLYRSALSHDGKLFACIVASQRSYQIRLWSMNSGKLLRQLDAAADVGGIAFSPDGKLLASAGPKNLCLWEVTTGRELHQFAGGQGNAVVFSPDGRHLAAGGNNRVVRVWDVVTGKEIQTLPGHAGAIYALRFSPDGRRLASGSGDTTVLVWDALRGQPEQPAELSDQRLDELWTALADPGDRAYEAFGSLVRSPGRAVPFLQSRLRPSAPVEAERVTGWIKDLDSDQFAVRQKAEEELERLGELAEPALRKALDGKPALEVRQRLEQLVAKIEGRIPTGENLRGLRAIWVLEWIGTPAARQMLEKLAAGMAESWQTQEARLAVERLNTSGAAKP